MDTIAENPRTIVDRTAKSRRGIAAVPVATGAAVTAWLVQAAFLNPGGAYEPMNAIATFLPLAVIAFAWTIAGRAGHLRGATGIAAGIGVTVTAIALFSLSLAFVSLGQPWIVAITAVAGFGITATITALAIRSER